MNETITPFTKFDEDKQIVFAEVYAPDHIDSQGDYMSREEIERMAYRFMAEGRVSKVDTNHDLKDNGSIVVESFIARDGDPDYIAGSWVVGVHVPDATLWEQVIKGELNGFSMYGGGVRKDRVVEIDIPDDGILQGDTLSKEDHEHEWQIRFDENGQFLGGSTLPDFTGHTHKILKGTATEIAESHNHRYSYMELLS
jgi:hypothetical protein